jgi:hypothetical protein
MGKLHGVSVGKNSKVLSSRAQPQADAGFGGGGDIATRIAGAVGQGFYERAIAASARAIRQVKSVF